MPGNQAKLGKVLRGVLAAGLVAAALAYAGVSLVIAGTAAARQAYEPLSSAEGRCATFFAIEVDSPAWSTCVGRESAKSPVAIAMPGIIRSLLAFGIAVVATTALLARRRSKEPGLGDSEAFEGPDLPDPIQP